MAQLLKVLLLEDSGEDAQLTIAELRRSGFSVDWQRVFTCEDFVSALERGDWDLVLADYSMPQFNAMDAVSILRESPHDIPLIVVTGTLDEETAVECLKRGADDYVLKENLTRLGQAVEQALRGYEDKRERRRLEEQLRHSQRIETVGTLAGGLAHDFNNLLTVIFGNLDIALSQLPEGSSVATHLKEIENAAEQAAGIANALLTFSHRAPAQKQVTSLADCCRDSARMASRLLPATIGQSWELPEDQVVTYADRTQIQQVLMNLLVNARDAMPEGGTVSVHVERCKPERSSISAQRKLGVSEWIRIDVSDTGGGMSEAVRQRIFEPFFTTKPRGQGTGLGLAIVHGIVEEHRGWIEVDSLPGSGTTFSVFLPLDAEVADLHKPDDKTIRSIPKNTGVLVVEDNTLVRSVMTTALRHAGCRVFSAEDGQGGVDEYRAHSNDIQMVVADCELPQMQGPACLDRIHEMSPKVKGLLITGRRDENLGLPKDGESGYRLLTKPFQVNQLLTELADLFHESQPE